MKRLPILFLAALALLLGFMLNPSDTVVSHDFSPPIIHTDSDPAVERVVESIVSTPLEIGTLPEVVKQSPETPEEHASDQAVAYQEPTVYDPSLIRYSRHVPTMAPYNDTAAISISTDLVRPASACNVRGEGQVIGLWDFGLPDTTHMDFGGAGNSRVTHKQLGTPAFNIWDIQHSTHVAGTMVGSGANDIRARGMADSATVLAFHWQRDIVEMDSMAALGLKLSNHSYGWLSGWERDPLGDGLWGWNGDTAVSLVEDFCFGFYDTMSYRTDTVAHKYPEYLIVAGAGNENWDGVPFAPPVGTQFHLLTNRSQNNPGYSLVTVGTGTGQMMPPPGDTANDSGLDMIACGKCTSKNTLCVGAVHDIPNHYQQPSDVIRLGFSSVGPTDDGRVKPDIVASGDWLLSADSDPLNTGSLYTTMRGTSMATPTVTGSIALLRQIYMNTHPNTPSIWSSTLKAIVIHTVDQAHSSFGPTAGTGWGLMNTQSAANLIKADSADTSRIQELTLNNGTTYNRIVFNDGSQPLKVTVVWNDPAGTILPNSLDPTTKMLVNDLDVRVTALNGPTGMMPFMPYGINTSNPWLPGGTGDNNSDNVEYVIAPAGQAGFYAISVGHKGTLQGGSQDFAMITSGYSTVCKYVNVTGIIPDNGQPGDTIMIQDMHYGSLDTNQHVFFGNSRAQVIGGGLQGLMVVVPEGATTAPVTVVDSMCGNYAASPVPFRTGFDCSGPIDSLTFRDIETISGYATLTDIEVADFDNDGRMDIIVCDSTYGAITVYQNFIPNDTIDSMYFMPVSVAPAGMKPTDIAVGDIDNDGWLDIAVADAADTNIHVYINMAMPGGIGLGFAGGVRSNSYIGNTCVAIGDLNKDGKQDIISGNIQSDSIRIMENASTLRLFGPVTMAFNAATNRSYGGSQTGIVELRIMDFDGDLFPEILVAADGTNSGANSAAVIHNNVLSMINMGAYNGLTAAFFGSQTNLGNMGGYGSAVDVGDFNNDGRIDLITCDMIMSDVHVYQNASAPPVLRGMPGNIGFGMPVMFMGGHGISFPRDVAVGHVNGDRDLDFAVVNTGDTTIKTMVNTGLSFTTMSNSTFGQPISDTIDSGVTELKIVDLDRDDKPDYSFINAKRIMIMENEVDPFHATLSLISPDTSCAPDPVILQANMGAYTSYTWVWNDTPAMQTPGGDGIQPVGATGNWTVIIEDSNGCVVRSLDTIFVVVHPITEVEAGPDDTLWINSGNDTMTGFSPAGGKWYAYEGATIDTNGVFTPDSAGYHRLTYEFVDSNGCFNMDEKFIIVLDTPDVGISMVLTDAFECFGGTEDVSVRLENFSNVPLMNVTVHWTINGNPRPPVTWNGFLQQNAYDQFTLDTATIDTGTAYTFQAWTVDPNDTVDLDNSNDSASSTVTLSPHQPQISASGSTTFCEGGSVTLSTDTAFYFEYTWYRDDTIIPGTVNTPEITANVSGTYTVVVQDNSKDCEATSDPVNVTVHDKPAVMAIKDTVVEISVDSIQLFASPPGGTWSGTGMTLNGWFHPVNVSLGTYNPIYTFTNGNGCTDADTLEVVVISNPDVGVSAIDTSNITSCLYNNRNVNVTIKNYDTSPLTSVDVDWVINGDTGTTYSWTGNLASGATVNVTVGTYDFDDDTTYSFTAWTKNPNGGSDISNGNDTSSVTMISFVPGMQGTYTIGGMGADYATFQESVDDLEARGVCSSVVFEVSDGTYNEQISIPAIMGASSSNRIKWTSDSQDSSLVVLTHGNDATNDYTLKLDGADYIDFDQITVERTGNQYNMITVWLYGSADYNRFTHNHIKGPISRGLLVYSGSTTEEDYNVFTENRFTGGSVSVMMLGAYYSIEEGNVFENNVMDSVTHVAMSMRYQKNLSITGNDFVDCPGGNVCGVYLGHAKEGVEVTGNTFDLPKGYAAILSYFGKGTSGNPVLIANNMINVGTPGYYYYGNKGIVLTSCYYHNVYHNTVQIRAYNNESGGRGLIITGDASYQQGNLNVVNNIFYSTGGALAVDINTYAANNGHVTKSDYNVLKNSGSYLAHYGGANKVSLAAWTSSSTLDSNSYSTTPCFVSSTDLHLNDYLLDDAGTPLSSVTVDIDGDSRSSTAPDIGADEYTYSSSKYAPYAPEAEPEVEDALAWGESHPEIKIWHDWMEQNIVVDMQFDRSDDVHIQVYDLQGKLMETRKLHTIEGSNVVRIPSAYLSQGIYICVTSHSRGQYVGKILKF